MILKTMWIWTNTEKTVQEISTNLPWGWNVRFVLPLHPNICWGRLKRRARAFGRGGKEGLLLYGGLVLQCSSWSFHASTLHIQSKSFSNYRLHSLNCLFLSSMANSLTPRLRYHNFRILERQRAWQFTSEQTRPWVLITIPETSSSKNVEAKSFNVTMLWISNYSKFRTTLEKYVYCAVFHDIKIWRAQHSMWIRQSQYQ